MGDSGCVQDRRADPEWGSLPGALCRQPGLTLRTSPVKDLLLGGLADWRVWPPRGAARRANPPDPHPGGRAGLRPSRTPGCSPGG